MRARIFSIATLVAAGIGAGVAAAAPTRVGSEFQVNTYTEASQAFVSIAADAAGDFVVVWASSGQDGSGYGVFGQRFSSTGSPFGAEFQVNTHTLGMQGGFYGFSDVSSGPDGDFVVVWTGSGIGRFDVFARRYDNAGMPIGEQFQVNGYTIGLQYYGCVVNTSDGGFVVAWADSRLDETIIGADVFARRFDSVGVAVGSEFQLNTYPQPVGGEFGPRLAADGDGGFVAVWGSNVQDRSGAGVFGRRFDSSGAALGPEFQVSTYTVGGQRFPSISAAPAGDFVVAWASYQDGSYTSVHARRYDSNGAELGSEFQVNSFTPGIQFPLREGVFTDANGRFTITWASRDQDGAGYGAFGQRYDSDGSPLGAEFQINTYTTNDQFIPVIAGGPAGDFLVSWQSDGQDGSGQGVFAQIFQAAPAATPTPTPTVTSTATPIGACPLTVDAGCTTGFEKGILLVKESVAARRKLIVKMTRGPALAQTDLGDPLEAGGTIYSLCIYDDTGVLAGGIDTSIVIDRAGATCSGRPCWKPIGDAPPNGRGYRYKDRSFAADGVLKILYKGGEVRRSKVIVKGKGPNLPAGITDTLQTTTLATVQLRASDGICLSMTVDDVKRQTPALFKAKPTGTS